MKLTRILLGFTVAAACAHAQQLPAGAAPQGRGGGGTPAAVRSPEISEDGRVTFRLRAPNATDVTVNGDWQGGRGMHMTKDASGLWSLTTPPLSPEIWQYTLSVDGVSTLDPGNYHVIRDGARYLNSLLIPGPGSTLLQTGRIPHGTVAEAWYPSFVLKTGRRMTVYTPPGYETSKIKYPVLYLFHGGGGDEEAWDVMGVANVIMDNLIVQGKAKPMIVVMPNANWTEPAVLDVGGPRPAAAGRGAGRDAPAAPGGGLQAPAGMPAGQSYDQAEQDIVGGMIPFIEAHYRALTGRENRAITGLSMGGGVSINVGLKRLDVFASVGEFSSGMFGGVGGYQPFDIEKISPGFLKDPAATNKKLKVFYFSCGTDDPRMPFQTKAADELKSHKIELTFKSFPGAHEWRVWRNSLADFAPMLFR